MDGFQKIDLDSEKDTVQVEPEMKRVRNKKKFRVNRSVAKKILIGFGVFLVLFIAFFVYPAYKTYKSALVTYKSARVLSEYVKKQDIDNATKEVKVTKESLLKTQKDFSKLFYLKYIPIVGWYYNDADHMIKAGVAGVDTGDILFTSLLPYADVLGLKGQGSFAGGSAEDRIKTAVLTMGKVTPRIDEISENLVVVRDELNQVDPDHYPSFIFGKELKEKLASYQEMTDQGVSLVEQARPLIKVLPSLLGEEEDKRYLVLFQNDAELRSTGGFLTAYSIFRFEKGVIHVDRSSDIYDLDNSIPSKSTAAEPIRKYLPGVSQANLRDSNLSPDFVTSMNEFNKLYNKAGQRVDVDGIIALDTHVLVSVLKVLDGEINAGGIKFTTENDPRCDCPQVIYELEDNISRPVNYVREDRKDLLGVLLYALMEKAMKSSPGTYWGPLFQDFLNQVHKKHVMFYLEDKEAQKGIEALNAAGRIHEFDGDYLHINDTSFSGAKTNLFIDQDVETSYEIKNDGLIVKTVTINYKNTHEPSDCNLERGGLCLNAELRNWLRLYVPKGSKLIDVKGSEVKMETKEDLGKTVFDGFITVRPLGKKSITITYSLPFKLEEGSVLPVLIQKQPGIKEPEYVIKVNGKTVNKFDLITDKKFDLEV